MNTMSYLRLTREVPVILGVALHIEHVKRGRDFLVICQVLAGFNDPNGHSRDLSQAIRKDQAGCPSSGD